MPDGPASAGALAAVVFVVSAFALAVIAGAVVGVFLRVVAAIA